MPTDDPPFAVGELVETIKGAKFWGEVVSCYRVPVILDETPLMPCYQWRCDVRAVDPGFLGTIHVYPAAQLARRPASSEAEPVAIDGLGEIETLSDRRLRDIRDNADNGMAARIMAGELLIARTKLLSPPAEPVTRAGVLEEAAQWHEQQREKLLAARATMRYGMPDYNNFSNRAVLHLEDAIAIRALAHSEPAPAPVVLKAAGTFYDDPRPAPATPPVNEITVHSGDGQSFTLLFNAEEECQPVILDRHFAEELSRKLSAALTAPATPVSDVTETLDERIAEVLDEDAPNKWVWKTFESMDEWLRDKVLPLLRDIRAARRSGGVADGAKE